MRHRINLIMVHDGGTNTYRTRTFPYFYLLESAIQLLLKHRFATVISHVYPTRFKLHQWVKMVINAINCLPFQWWQYLKRNQRILCLFYVFSNLHTVIFAAIYNRKSLGCCLYELKCIFRLIFYYLHT